MAFEYRIGGIVLSGENINELKEFAEELGQLAKDSGNDLSKHLNDACFSIDVDYQQFHNLNEDDWSMVHNKH